MADRKNNVHVFTPPEAESVRYIHQTDEDRKTYLEEFRTQKEHEQKLKEERFAAMKKRKKKKGSGGSCSGINIEVTANDN